MKQAEGMWEFPMFSELPAGSFSKIGACRHTITHHRLDVSVYEGELEERGFDVERRERDSDVVPDPQNLGTEHKKHKRHKLT